MSILKVVLLVPFLVVWALIEALSPQPGAATVRAVAPMATALPSDIFTLTVGAAIAWLTSTGIALALAYVVNSAGVPPKWAEPIQYVGSLVLVALVTGIAHYISPQWLDARLIDAAVALITFLVNQAGLMVGSLSGMEHRARIAQLKLLSR